MSEADGNVHVLPTLPAVVHVLGHQPDTHIRTQALGVWLLMEHTWAPPHPGPCPQLRELLCLT